MHHPADTDASVLRNVWNASAAGCWCDVRLLAENEIVAARMIGIASAAMPPLPPRVLLVIVDGLGDVAIAQQQREEGRDRLPGSTPLQSTPTPHLDALASQTSAQSARRCGRTSTCPQSPVVGGLTG